MIQHVPAATEPTQADLERVVDEIGTVHDEILALHNLIERLASALGADLGVVVGRPAVDVLAALDMSEIGRN